MVSSVPKIGGWALLILYEYSMSSADKTLPMTFRNRGCNHGVVASGLVGLNNYCFRELGNDFSIWLQFLQTAEDVMILSLAQSVIFRYFSSSFCRSV